MKKLINDVLHVVPDSLKGFARLHPGLAMIEGHSTVVRADLDAFRSSGKVAIVSGGGAGHEPAHAGYVGRGMLTAAVSGDVFASPAIDAVHAALRAVGTPAGILMIVKNYTGDRINFGVAAEMARAEGISVETVIVDDDAALGTAEGTAGRRGIAGTVLIHKIAGAAAEAGLGLAEVKARSQAAAGALASMGIALSPCTVPAAGRPNFELGEDEIELGLGIHGEPGVERRAIGTSAALVDVLLDRLIADRGIAAGDEVALMVNNLGTTPVMELGIVAGDALDGLRRRGVVVSRAYCGTFLTAIDMAGVSLSLLRLDYSLRQALDAPTEAPSWPAPASGSPDLASAPVCLRAEDTPARDAANCCAPPAPAAFLSAVRAGCEALLRTEAELTEMDRRVGDGDIGRSLAQGATAIMQTLERAPDLPVERLLSELSRVIRSSVGGTSGPLYAAFALSAANALRDLDAAAPTLLAEGFAAGVSSVSRLGGAQEGDRTMLDALAPALREIRAHDRVGPQLEAAAAAARRGAERTAQMMPKLGRSSYLGSRALGCPDPGAEAVAIWLTAASISVVCDATGYAEPPAD
ncbi:dihydroxyacetone kinase subunit DhaL [Inquilinus limosus]|uniref:Dihydroxyacetone kinase n=1 Tax=Inquilinus limosus TaxID=171674 RepID=A0A211ZEN1_9PROT|nr:dihydroxyacetone kinase subunit DhaL [Inquilinus limosus]OWJ63739.1 dihydroxyacetone kinase [Inquilinus limosus]